MWHWVYLLTAVPGADLGPDGHPERGGFLPPVSQRRRMVAGGRSELFRPLIIGSPVTRSSSVIDVRRTRGRDGPLVFVTVRDEVSDEDGLAVSEERYLVYTDAPPRSPLVATVPVPDAPWCTTLHTDPVLLFRFSALTFNGHRIHYDASYATGVEGYAGLVVHGPLIALHLLELAANHGLTDPGRFSFRATAPALCGTEMSLRGSPRPDGADLAAYTSEGMLVMTASVEHRHAAPSHT